MVLLLALVMLTGMLPMRVFATEGTQETEAVEVVTEPTEAPEEEVNVVHEHTYENGVCTGCGDHIGPVTTEVTTLTPTK